jgi:hypothetical protein
MTPVPRATLTFAEVLPVNRDGSPNPKYPQDRQCKSGHKAPEGARFFVVSGPTLDRRRWGLYCQTCMRVAFMLKDKQKEVLGDGGK